MADRKDFRRGQGIQTFEIDAARQVHARTVRARIPTPVVSNNTLTSTAIGASSTRAVISLGQPAGPNPLSRSPQRSPSHNPTRHKCNNPRNPSCEHCGSMIVPSPVATLPLEDHPSMTINNWTISTRKKPILNSKELDEWEHNKLKGLTLPEMIFGNSFVRIDETTHKWSIEFNALDALKDVKLEDSGIRVSYSKKWMDSKQEKQRQQQQLGIIQGSLPPSSEIDGSALQIARHYDWTYTTRYKGTERTEDESHKFVRDDSQEIPFDKLARPDHILFYDDMILFEDELADNGISILNIKIRVMSERLLLLSRFFLRVDDVLVRVMDTRVAVEFDENKVIREYKEMEGDYKSLLNRQRISHSHDPKAALRDSNWVAQNIPLIKRECHVLQL